MSRPQLPQHAQKSTSMILAQADIGLSKLDFPTTIMHGGTFRLIEEMESLCQMLLAPLVQSDEMAIGVQTAIVRWSPMEVGRKVELTAYYTGRTSVDHGKFYMFVVEAFDGEREVGLAGIAYDIIDLRNETPKNEGADLDVTEYTIGYWKTLVKEARKIKEQEAQAQEVANADGTMSREENISEQEGRKSSLTAGHNED